MRPGDRPPVQRSSNRPLNVELLQVIEGSPRPGGPSSFHMARLGDRQPQSKSRAIHGGSLRIFVEHATDGIPICASVSQMLSDEVHCGLEGFSFYENLPTRVSRLRKCLLEQLRALKSEGLRIAAYGASAKGATLLNHFGIGSDILDFVVDRNAAKQGLYTPGTHLPIYAVDKLLQSMPDYVLLLTWNFVEEILEQQSEYRRRGGRFIVPIPELRVV